MKQHLQELQELKSVLLVLQGDHAAPSAVPSRRLSHIKQPASGEEWQSADLPDVSSATGWQQHCHQQRVPGMNRQLASKDLDAHKQPKTSSCHVPGRLASQPSDGGDQLGGVCLFNSDSMECHNGMFVDQPATQVDAFRGQDDYDRQQKHSGQPDNMTQPAEVTQQGKENDAEAAQVVDSLLVAGSTVLRSSASTDAMPSFLHKAKVWDRMHLRLVQQRCHHPKCYVSGRCLDSCSACL